MRTIHCLACGHESSLPLPEERKVCYYECPNCKFRFGFWSFEGPSLAVLKPILYHGYMMDCGHVITTEFNRFKVGDASYCSECKKDTKIKEVYVPEFT